MGVAMETRRRLEGGSREQGTGEEAGKNKERETLTG